MPTKKELEAEVALLKKQVDFLKSKLSEETREELEPIATDPRDWLFVMYPEKEIFQ